MVNRTSPGGPGSQAEQRPSTTLARPKPSTTPVVLDADQSRVVEHPAGPLLVLAGPGTGKTTTLVELVARRVQTAQVRVDQVLMLTFSRRAAAELRSRLALRLGHSVREPIARTLHSYAYGLIRRAGVRRGDPPPRLLPTPEQDLLVRDLLRGDLAELDGGYWPEELRLALGTRGFAEEVREFLARAAERGLDPDDLVDLGKRRDRPEWVAAGHFAAQYAQVTALRSAQQSLDPTALVGQAVRLLTNDAEVLQTERSLRRLIVIDEFQDTDPVQERLLRLLAGGGRDLVAVGDPDQSIYGFRGADPDVVRRFPDAFPDIAGKPAPVVALRTSRRCGPTLTAASRRVAARLGGPASHRRLQVPGDVPDSGRVSVRVLESAPAEAADIAAVLRRSHLLSDVPWSDMAGLVRSLAEIPPLARRLRGAGIPVVVRSHQVSLLQLPAARALLSLLDAVAAFPRFDGEAVIDIMQGPFVASDPLTVRRIRRQLRTAELAAGGDRSSLDLLVDQIQVLTELALAHRIGRGSDEPTHSLAAEPHHRMQRLADILAAGLAEMQQADADPERVLTAIWQASGMGEVWRRQVLTAAQSQVEADAHLDAVGALLETAGEFVDRLPGTGIAAFLDTVRDVLIPSDSGTDPALRGGAVSLMTAHAAKGLEFDVVVVSGVQEGVWPNLRVPASLLGADELVAAVDAEEGSGVERASAQLAEERRLFYVATTRARRHLHVTAVADADNEPSRFLVEIDPALAEQDDWCPSPGARPIDLAAIVAELRRVLVHDEIPDALPSLPKNLAERRRVAARWLARLADAGVPGADPEQWYGLPALSTQEPLSDGDDPVRVSPSGMASVLACGVRAFLQSAGGSRESVASGTGALIHDLAHRVALGELSTEDVLPELDRRWHEVSVASGWVDRRQAERARQMARRLTDWLQASGRELVAAEEPFDVVSGSARLVGRIDRIERDESGRLVVVDLKTGSSAARAADLEQDPQLGAYQVAVCESDNHRTADQSATEGGGAELVQLGLPTPGAARVQSQPAIDPTDQDSWVRGLLEEAAASIAASTKQATVGPLCRVCPVRTCCPLQPEGRGVVA